jgi:hypothetical protein
MRVVLAVGVATLFCACSGRNDKSGPPPACAPRRDDLYLVHYTLREGACEELPDEVEPVNESQPQPPWCNGTIDISSDHCTTKYDYACTAFGGYRSVRGSITWSADARHGAGTLTLNYPATGSSIGCAGTFDVTFTRT